jgi:FkbM family methyltransferase
MARKAGTGMGAFKRHLFWVLKSSRFNDHRDNWDTFFYGQPPAKPGVAAGLVNALRTPSTPGPSTPQPSADGLGEKMARLFAFLENRFTYYLFPKRHFQAAIQQFRPFAFTYGVLADSASRDLYVSLLAHYILGFRKVKLARNNALYREGPEQVRQLDTGRPSIRLPQLAWLPEGLRCFDCVKLGYDMRVYSYAEAIAINFVQKQYVLQRDHDELCKVEPGDVVIDAGGCWGDTALQFAYEVGPKGHVYTFEFAPGNLEVMRQNIALNPHLGPRITILEHPIGAVSGGKMFYMESGPASRIASTKLDDRYMECTVLSIDGMVREWNPSSVDFIKMDIEGSELDALKGAEETIRKYRPKLAICIYHAQHHYIAIPQFIDSLGLGYRFYIEHHTIFLEETVLFAVPEDRN